MFPGQRNDLDSLCRRFEINNSHRELHGALLDAEILADVYLAMTGGQASFSLEAQSDSGVADGAQHQGIDFSSLQLPQVQVSSEEAENHVEWIARLDDKVGGECVWSKINNASIDQIPQESEKDELH